jgi:tRNA(Ile)-lysidine synthase
LPERIAAQLASLTQPGDRLTVGLSGGVDSIVLLDILRRLRARLRVKLSALHVNHRLSRNAVHWAAFCRRASRAHGVPCRVVEVSVRRSNSIEGAARAARYAVFAREPCDYLLLAQHQDDQVETVLLQLLRGTGVRGLAGMPLMRKDEGARILRPLLDVTRTEILDYAKARGLKWIEDESNRDTQFTRNFLRHEVLPAIARRFPAYRAAVARAAGHLGDAAGLLDDLAAADGADYLEHGTLAVAGLARLPQPRARNLLRHFLAGHGVLMPDAKHLDEALRQARSAKEDARLVLDLGEYELRRFEGRLHVVAKGAAPRDGYARRWRGERTLALPALGGVLTMAPAQGRGINLERLVAGPVSIRVRRGGERLQPDCRRPCRTLKNLLQEARIPPWERERLPLVYSGGTLVWIPGVGIDCAYQARAGERAVDPTWRPALAR